MTKHLIMILELGKKLTSTPTKPDLKTLSTDVLRAKLRKLDAVYHITEDVQMRYKIMQAEDEIKHELKERDEEIE